MTNDKKLTGSKEEAATARPAESLAEPVYPILKIEELPPTQDLRRELPLEISKYLKPHQKVVHIRHPEVIWPERQFSALEICMRAASARQPEEIGDFGPTVASVNLNNEHDRKSRYESQHGRDDLQAGTDLFPIYPKLLETTVRSLAMSQGVQNEPYVEGQPHGQEKIGSIILLDREPSDGLGRKFSRLGHWRFPFYGSVDAPASFLNAIAVLQKNNPGYLRNRTYRPRDWDGYDRPMSQAFERSVQWLTDCFHEHDGLVAYKNPIKNGGMRNQGWRDSATAIVHKDGSWASDQYGVAPIEVQGFAYDAFMNSADIFRSLYFNDKKAAELEEMAREIRDTVIGEGFISSDAVGFFASGFDWDSRRGRRPLEVMTSAAGRLLGSRLLKTGSPEIDDMVRQTIKSLLAPSMLTRWGIRTLSSDESSFVPFLYHDGPVWTHDTNEIAKGMSNHGYFGLDRIVGAMTSNLHGETGVYYEHVSGYDSEAPIVPRRDTYVYDQKYDELYLFEQVPPRGQTWAASTDLAKHHRYEHIPETASQADKLKFEKEVWRQLPDHIKAVATYYEPRTALVLSGGNIA